MERLLMARRTAGVVVGALALFAASFTVARAGRPEAERAAAAAPAQPLRAVTVSQGVGDLRTLPAASLPKLAKTPEPTPDPGTSPEPGPAPDPGPSRDPGPSPDGEPPGGCDPCG